jgi:indolepyruvate ferredoxin oxidoreductase beta subunit
MPETAPTLTNIVVAGLGGQGVLKASDIIADAAFLAGYDVKKSEIHGMSQRGGSVSSDVRFGKRVLSPMAPDGEVDYLLMLDPDQTPANEHRLRPGGKVVDPELFFDEDEGVEDIDDLDADEETPISRRNLNVAMLGVLSFHLDIPDDAWAQAIKANLPENVHEENLAVFAFGQRSAAEQAQGVS